MFVVRREQSRLFHGRAIESGRDCQRCRRCGRRSWRWRRLWAMGSAMRRLLSSDNIETMAELLVKDLEGVESRIIASKAQAARP
jgi:hypothetical protein